MIGIFAICFKFERIKYATAVTITQNTIFISCANYDPWISS